MQFQEAVEKPSLRWWDVLSGFIIKNLAVLIAPDFVDPLPGVPRQTGQSVTYG